MAQAGGFVLLRYYIQRLVPYKEFHGRTVYFKELQSKLSTLFWRRLFIPNVSQLGYSSHLHWLLASSPLLCYLFINIDYAGVSEIAADHHINNKTVLTLYCQKNNIVLPVYSGSEVGSSNEGLDESYSVFSF